MLWTPVPVYRVSSGGGISISSSPECLFGMNAGEMSV